MEKEILKKIKETRELKGITQLELANSLEISLVSYSKIERGETKLTINHIERIAKVLDVNPNYLVSGTQSNEDILELKKEIETLKKDIERYKSIIDTYRDKIEIADILTELIKDYEKFKKNKDSGN